jgi:hypothetical protein
MSKLQSWEDLFKDRHFEREIMLPLCSVIAFTAGNMSGSRLPKPAIRSIARFSQLEGTEASTNPAVTRFVSSC